MRERIAGCEMNGWKGGCKEKDGEEKIEEDEEEGELRKL